jgi:hypothetical protein
MIKDKLIKLGAYSFAGPYTSLENVKDKSGVYAIVCEADTEYFLLDVGESFKLRTRIENSDKKDCWKQHCNGQLQIFVHYTPFLKQLGRIHVEQELRELFHPNCKLDKRIWFPEIQ